MPRSRGRREQRRAASRCRRVASSKSYVHAEARQDGEMCVVVAVSGRALAVPRPDARFDVAGILMIKDVDHVDIEVDSSFDVKGHARVDAHELLVAVAIEVLNATHPGLIRHETILV